MLSKLRDSFGEGMAQGARVGLMAVGVLGLFALAWVVSGLLIGGTSGQQSSTVPEQTSADSERLEALENNAKENELPEDESYSAYQSKDPFRQLVAPAQESTNGGGGTTGGGGGQSSGGGSAAPDGASPGEGARQPSGGGAGQPPSGGGTAGGDRDLAPLPEGDSAEGESTAPGGQRGTGGGAPEGGDGLFDSGGSLPPPR
jgi:hypothetical protein